MSRTRFWPMVGAAALVVACSSTGPLGGTHLDPTASAACRGACNQATCGMLCSASCSGVCSGDFASGDFAYVDSVDCGATSVTFHKGGSAETCSP